jgi:hypothetical protein
MPWLEAWRAISARIESLVRAGDLTLASLKVNNSDPSSVVRKFLVPGLESVKNELHQLNEEYASVLPPAAAESLRRFLQDWQVPAPPNAGKEVSGIQAAIPLSVFRSEFDYLIRDAEVEARVLTELAFEHLRRLLAVDPAVRKNWIAAFEKREEHCERLGAVHLLGHGIWAFKVSTIGAATDLVFGEPLDSDLETIGRTARALVLTEWKLIEDAEEVESMAAKARRQAQLYSTTIFPGVELKRTRYIVLVSRKSLPLPGNQELEGITYRHIGLPLELDSVSEEARRGKTT